jgi:hypothetical protein
MFQPGSEGAPGLLSLRREQLSSHVDKRTMSGRHRSTDEVMHEHEGLYEPIRCATAAVNSVAMSGFATCV